MLKLDKVNRLKEVGRCKSAAVFMPPVALLTNVHKRRPAFSNLSLLRVGPRRKGSELMLLSVIST